ncbi:MAG: hypothetical protein PVI80_07195, partial [Anaerolineae bacterium]
PERSLVESGVLARAREACDREGLDFGLWTVGLHNSTLGQQNRDLCIENCFGDRYTYCLCPSQEPVRAYLQGVIQDLCTQLRPERIIQEAVGYLGLRHWVHHELFFAAGDGSLEMLLSLCFCPSCQQRAGAAGLEAGRLRKKVATWGEKLLHGERGSLPPAFTQSQVPSLLAESPDLAAFMQVRAGSVTELVADLHATAKEQGAELDLIPASFHRPVSQAWLEGALLGKLQGVSDYLLIPSYFESADQVAADLEWAAWLAPESELVAGLNACEPAVRSAAGLAAQARACREAGCRSAWSRVAGGQELGCRGIYYFNYGLLTRERLAWVGEANAGVTTT